MDKDILEQFDKEFGHSGTCVSINYSDRIAEQRDGLLAQEHCYCDHEDIKAFITKAIQKEKEAMAKEMIDVVKRYYPELNKIEDEIAVSFMYKELKGIAKNNKLNIE